MSAKPVLKMGHPKLRRVSVPMTKEEILSPETKKLISDMQETMKKEHGIGLAAPQIGINKRICLIEVESENQRYNTNENSGLFIVINPQITILDRLPQGMWEGCLSVPGLRGYVERPREIRIDYLNEKAEAKSIIAKDLLSSVFQHEIDHLDGRIYIDHITDLTKFSFIEEFEEHWT